MPVIPGSEERQILNPSSPVPVGSASRADLMGDAFGGLGQAMEKTAQTILQINKHTAEKNEFFVAQELAEKYQKGQQQFANNRRLEAVDMYDFNGDKAKEQAVENGKDMRDELLQTPMSAEARRRVILNFDKIDDNFGQHFLGEDIKRRAMVATDNVDKANSNILSKAYNGEYGWNLEKPMLELERNMHAADGILSPEEIKVRADGFTGRLAHMTLDGMYKTAFRAFVDSGGKTDMRGQWLAAKKKYGEYLPKESVVDLGNKEISMNYEFETALVKKDTQNELIQAKEVKSRFNELKQRFAQAKSADDYEGMRIAQSEIENFAGHNSVTAEAANTFARNKDNLKKLFAAKVSGLVQDLFAGKKDLQTVMDDAKKDDERKAFGDSEELNMGIKIAQFNSYTMALPKPRLDMQKSLSAIDELKALGPTVADQDTLVKNKQRMKNQLFTKMLDNPTGNAVDITNALIQSYTSSAQGPSIKVPKTTTHEKAQQIIMRGMANPSDQNNLREYYEAVKAKPKPDKQEIPSALSPTVGGSRGR